MVGTTLLHPIGLPLRPSECLHLKTAQHGAGNEKFSFGRYQLSKGQGFAPRDMNSLPLLCSAWVDTVLAHSVLYSSGNRQAVG